MSSEPLVRTGAMIQTMPKEKKMTVPPEVVNLVERFERNLDAYSAPTTKRPACALSSLTPSSRPSVGMYTTSRGTPSKYKDVVHEDAIKVSRATRASGDGRRGPRPRCRGQDARNPFSLLGSRQQMKRGYYA